MLPSRIWLVCVLLVGGFACAESEETFWEPPIIQNDDSGVLELSLSPKYSSIEIGDAALSSRVYLGVYAPATLALAAGDSFQITLLNDLPTEETNLHFDGMNVSPLPAASGGEGDDVFLSISPGETLQYDVEVPADHPAGMFAYRPAPFGLTAGQVGNGMAGAIIVKGLLDPFPGILGIRQRILLLKDIQIEDDGTALTPPDTELPTVLTVNGQLNPRIPMQPGEMQFWRVANASADLYYRLAVEGHTLYEVARDGNRRTRLLSRQEALLPPAARIEFFVRAGEEGDYALTAQTLGNQPPGYETFFQGDGVYSAGACASAGVGNTTGCSELSGDTCMGPQGPCLVGGQLATLAVEGDRVTAPQLPSDDQFPAVTDLRNSPLCRRRTVNFQQELAASNYLINDRPFDPDRIDVEVDLPSVLGQNCVEEWQINNCTGENHVFQIGQVDFQVVEVDGQAVEFVGYQDTVNLRFRDCDRQEETDFPCKVETVGDEEWPLFSCASDEDPVGRVVVRVLYSETALGKFTFQCAEAGHADNGQMATILVCDESEVVCSGTTPTDDATD